MPDAYPASFEACRYERDAWFIRGWGSTLGRYVLCVQGATFASFEPDSASVVLGAGGWGWSSTFPIRPTPLDLAEMPLESTSRHTVYAGLPLPCLRGWHDESGGCDRFTSGIGSMISTRSGALIPCAPIWWGLLGNTLAFGATWHAALLGIAGAQARRRITRGQCAACTYDLRGLPPNSPCPECGRASVPHPNPQTS